MEVNGSLTENGFSEENYTIKTTTVTQEIVQNGISSIKSLEITTNGTLGNNLEKPLLNGHTVSEQRIVHQTVVSSVGDAQGIGNLIEGESPEQIKEEAFPEVVSEVVDSSKAQLEVTESKPLPISSEENKYLNGPNQVVPAEETSTSSLTVKVKLPIADKGFAAQDPISIPGILQRTVQNYPNHPAMRIKKDGVWNTITYKEYEEAVRTCAKAYLSLGLERYHSVCILGFNSPQWFISGLAAIYAGGILTGVYTTNSSEACFHSAKTSRANIIVVEDKKQLDKILQIKHRLPELKAIVQYEGTPDVEGVLSWEDLMKLGHKQSSDALENTLKTLSINECCTLIYTSGTVGNPKAVMLNHDNLTFTAASVASQLDICKGSEVVVSYLPLSHVAAQMLDIYISITYAVTVCFADKDALKGGLLHTLQDVRPTQFLGVPRVWEKISEKMIHLGSQVGGLKKAIASWAKSQGLQHNMNKMNGVHGTSFRFMVANMLIFRRIKKVLGLDRCKNFFSGAAPLSADVKKYFMSLDMPIMELFGMSESSGPHTYSTKNDFRLDSIGRTLPGLQTVVHNPDEKGEGELCLGGRNVFMGYLNDTEKTREAIDNAGLLHSGDVGKIDKDGFLYITGRIKEIIITAGGENIPPVLIEHTVQGELPCISNAVLIGERRKFLSILLTLKTEVNSETGEPLDELTAVTKSWCEAIGSSAQTVSEILNGPDEKVMAAIQRGIDEANKKAISNAQRIQKFIILPKDFSVPSGEMGPTMKLKRNVISEKYCEVIERFYKGT